MRKLAEELGVEAMSLYHHVANKDDLLDGMIDIVFSEIDPPAGRRRLEGRAARAGDLDARRAAPAPLGGRPDGGARHPRARRTSGSTTRCSAACASAGFSIEMTVHAYSVQDAYIYGFAPPAGGPEPGDARRTSRRSRQQQMVDYEAVLADFPHLVEVVGGHVAKVGYDYDAEFVFGLDLILDALERRLPAR